jgi:hypothetical protein
MLNNCRNLQVENSAYPNGQDQRYQRDDGLGHFGNPCIIQALTIWTTPVRIATITKVRWLLNLASIELNRSINLFSNRPMTISR